MPLYLQTKIHHSKRLQLERSCFLKASRCVGNNGIVMAKNNTKCSCKCFGKFSNKLWKQYPSKNLNHQHLHFTFPSQRNPIPQEVFPPQILLRGHGCLCSVHPRPPRPPGAAPPRRRGLCGLPSAAVCSLGSPRTRGQAAGQNPNGTKGRKTLRKNLGTSKVKVLENCGHSKSSMDLRNIVCLRCLEDIELVEKTVAFGVLSKPCQPCLQSTWTWINSNILQFWKTNTPKIGTPQNLKTIPFLVRVSCHRPNSHINW